MTSIDRTALVRRHNPTLRAPDAMNPLSVGNGEFAFSFDVTGLQTLVGFHAANGTPLCTMSQWGWHSFPTPPELAGQKLRLAEYAAAGRRVGYATDPANQEQLFNHLRENPHRLHLGRIGFTFDSNDISPADLSSTDQQLDLFTGIADSQFELAGQRVRVETVCAGDTDAVGVRIASPLLASRRLRVRFAFPYGSPAVPAAGWNRPDAHRTDLTRTGERSARFLRTLDQTRYVVTLTWQGLADLQQISPHEFELESTSNELRFVCRFDASERSSGLDFESAREASIKLWRDYWLSGGAIELAGSRDSRANELERRIVLSQYLMRVNAAGSLPPAETGLTCNSWYGKFHLEMHWWHGVHWAQWNRLPLLERSLGYYERILPAARELARSQGYIGARWPKMVGPEGIDSPSAVGPLLFWQQPHPIYYAELCYRAKPDRATLERWREIVESTAEFMASVVVFDSARGVHSLMPPMKTVSENNPADATNPAFELSQWRFGLRVAQQWNQRLGRPRNERWDRVLRSLAPLPTVDDCYAFQENTPDTFSKWNWEHPAIVGVRGVLPGDGVDADTHRRTVERVMKCWQWDRCWGWDFPMLALAATRAGRPDLAVDALFIESTKNTYSIAGHNYQRPGLTLYLPGNGGLLTAVAAMAAGFDGCGVPTPGFPRDRWNVRFENLSPMMAV